MTSRRIVPVDPTEEMIKAGRDAYNKVSRSFNDTKTDHALIESYKAMLAAAPAEKTSELADLMTKLELAERDAERYRYLRNGNDGNLRADYGRRVIRHKKLDAAIDAARQLRNERE